MLIMQAAPCFSFLQSEEKADCRGLKCGAVFVIINYKNILEIYTKQ